MVLVQSSFHTTWASLFEMELEPTLLDWNVNELKRKLELEDMKRTIIYAPFLILLIIMIKESNYCHSLIQRGEQGFLLLVSWSSSPIESRKVYTATPRLLPKSRLNREFLSPMSNLELSFWSIWAAQGSKEKSFNFSKVYHFWRLVFHVFIKAFKIVYR